MNKLFKFYLLGVSLALISWGFKGHRALATIAQKHLTSNTAYVVSAYLGGESMADVSTWADENKNRATAPWHFVNLPLINALRLAAARPAACAVDRSFPAVDVGFNNRPFLQRHKFPVYDP